MNVIKVFNTIGLYTDRTKSARYYFQEINQAVIDAIDKKINSITDTDNPNKVNGIDGIQRFRDELYTLIKSTTPAAPTGPTTITTIEGDFNKYHLNFPTDYRTYDRLSLITNSVTTYARETTSNEIGPLLDCSFRCPKKKKVYFLEDSTGLNLYSADVDTISSVTLTYIKQPATFYMGVESQLISEGAGVLAINSTYIAFEDSVYNGVTYASGVEFTTNGALTDLTSGQVILKSLTTTIELPEKTHDEICKMAAAILLGPTEDFEKSAFAEKESNA